MAELWQGLLAANTDEQLIETLNGEALLGGAGWGQHRALLISLLTDELGKPGS